MFALSLLWCLDAAPEGFDLIFLDPPFGMGMIERIIPMATRLMAPTGLLYIESEAPLDAAGMAAHGLSEFRADKAGAVHYHLLQFSASQGAQDANWGLSGNV